MEQWGLCRSSATKLDAHLTCPLLSWSTLTATLVPPTLMAPYISLLFAAAGPPQGASAHVSSCPLSWHGQSLSTNHRVSPWTRWSSTLARENSPQASRLQLPLKLAWAVTIHKSQGLTLDKVVIDVGKREFSSGLTFVACSRVCQLQDILFTPPFPYQCLSSLSNSSRLKERQQEDKRLQSLN